MSKKITVTGKIEGDAEWVKFREKKVKHDGKNFEIEVPLKMGKNKIEVTYKIEDEKQKSTSVTVTRISKNQYLAEQKKAEFDAQFTLAGGKMWTGVKLYYGVYKSYIGEIVCFNRNYRHPILKDIEFNGVKVHIHNSKAINWKNREAVRYWFVRKDDPAIKAQQYIECKY